MISRMAGTLKQRPSSPTGPGPGPVDAGSLSTVARPTHAGALHIEFDREIVVVTFLAIGFELPHLGEGLSLKLPFLPPPPLSQYMYSIVIITDFDGVLKVYFELLLFW